MRLGEQPVTDRPAGYVLNGGQHVAYRGSDSHIHELYWNGDLWVHTDLIVASGADKVAGTSAIGHPAGYTLSNSQHVVYRGSDDHIHELYWEGAAWGHNDLTLASGASKLSGTAAAGDPAGYTLNDSQHVVYRGSDGHIHELYWEGAAWGHNNLTLASGASKLLGTAAAGDPAGYALNKSQHVVFRGSDGDIHEFYSQDGSWGHNDLTVASGAAKIFGTPATSDPSGYILKDSQHVVYRGRDGHI